MTNMWGFLPVIDWHTVLAYVSSRWHLISRSVHKESKLYQEAAKRDREQAGETPVLRRPVGENPAVGCVLLNLPSSNGGRVRLIWHEEKRMAEHKRCSVEDTAIVSFSPDRCSNCDIVDAHHIATVILVSFPRNTQEAEWLKAAGAVRCPFPDCVVVTLCRVCRAGQPIAFGRVIVHGVELAANSF